MQGEGVGGRLATWVAGVLGVWAGLAALGSLIAAIMFPQWALVREPIVLAESPSRSIDFLEDGLKENDRAQALQPVVTTVTFRLGLWTACPHINTTNLHLLVGSPPCSGVRYSWEHITHQDLRLPAPAPLVQTVLARMRLSTPFMMLSCCLLAIGTLLAIVGRCCYAHASLVAALLYSLGGLSVGVGVVWFVSVISEEYSMASGRRTSWSDMYAYRYGWSVMTAGVGGVAALLAALLTGHSHLARHAPLVTVLRARSSSTDESLAKPLLRCRSEGCLGQRSFTSETIRTYLTCDSRRHPQRGCPLPLPHSTSIVDLTKPTEDLSYLQEDSGQTQEDTLSDMHTSRRSSKVTIVGDDVRILNYPQHQYQHQLLEQQQTEQQQDQGEEEVMQHPLKKIRQSTLERSWSEDTSRVIIESPRCGSTSQIITPVPPPPPLSSSSSSPSPLEAKPPPFPATSSGSSRRSSSGGVTRLAGDPSPLEAKPPPLPTTSSGSSRRSSSGGVTRLTGDPLRLPEYNSFTVVEYSRTLPTKGRQLAVFNRRSMHRSTTLSRSNSKISSEV
ncbi:uncharacterized protein [Palaemon carinicauda]|uniref:uncharacterized protein n=1 Tax=Palaemon carinicauda TaxID=392227 RepID=UPI0035B62F35